MVTTDNTPMRPHSSLVPLGALLGVLAIACTGIGEGSDPGAAPAAPHARGILNIEDFSVRGVGHVVADDTSVFAFLMGARVMQESMGLFELDPTGGPARELWNQAYPSMEGRGWPLILSRPGRLTWVVGSSGFGGSNPAQGCAIYRWSRSDAAAASKYATIADSNCVPVGIVGDDQEFFAFVAMDSGCGYSFSGRQESMGCRVEAQLFRFGGDAGAPSAGPKKQLVTSMPNPVWYDGAKLYWFSPKQDNGGFWSGAFLVSMPKASDTEADIVELDAASYPVGFAMAGDTIYYATSRPTGEQGGSNTMVGCEILRVPRLGGKATRIHEDKEHLCRGLSVDASHAWFATGWVDSGQTWREGVQRTTLTQAEPPPPLLLDRDQLSPLVTVQRGTDLIVAAPLAVVMVPKSIVP